ncbi:hypothetical protein [Cognatilysobacter lacus]|uniref:Uncharacterized protein n=1 Tax=Cognatilysobacter lacus TaxID=1643323 RepID=A0A5D8YY00_9GAMM|nr:hypothetical protein [Lysobacter lacus]TZF86692.1 hypothetical protein FW784_12025 [Lysobacter lacus]
MDTLFAVFAFLASLAGFHSGRDTVVHRVVTNGVYLLASRATVEAGVARFECMRSASGRCHYLVLPHDCSDSKACTGRRYDVAVGDVRQVAGLHAFRLCVSGDASAPAQCASSDGLAD